MKTPSKAATAPTPPPPTPKPIRTRVETSVITKDQFDQAVAGVKGMIEAVKRIERNTSVPTSPESFEPASSQLKQSGGTKGDMCSVEPPPVDAMVRDLSTRVGAVAERSLSLRVAIIAGGNVAVGVAPQSTPRESFGPTKDLLLDSFRTLDQIEANLVAIASYTVA